ncbi:MULTISPECIES: recombinase family protein [unclassified Bradyrhizobium]|uniref:recombinase family protein n=1 Tax=unclassified Bradyrhizobium TaxID=2631580 RepID=UPI0021125E32|nr:MULTISPECIES: recombinase family protein [unclassified Bradyrhizobium]
MARRTRARRAAQYVRMSRELQRYSTANQMAAIAAYAEANTLTIVRTYRDEGRSGLRIKGRPGLIELIEDVQSGRAAFDHILVYDVSRWGRFQDVDESAYYEFLCKRSGVQVEYCAEIFKNDGTFVSGIAKSLKRGMAAEWSRELSVKVHAGHCRVASLGYRVGAPVGYGLMIPTILGNENYIGKTVYNRTSRRLGQKLVKNPDNAWVRGAAAIEPIVDQGIFARAQKLLADRRVEIPEEEMLLRLRLTLRRRGKLNSHIINRTLGLNHVSSYVKHFGSLRKAYALIGYVSPRDCDWIDTREFLRRRTIEACHRTRGGAANGTWPPG